MGRVRRNAWLWGGWLFFLGVLFVPSIWILDQTIGEELGRLILGGSEVGLPSRRELGLFGRSVALGLGASLVAGALGTMTGYLTARVAFAGRRLLFALLLLPFFVPAYCYATAWVVLLAPGTVPISADPSPAPVYSLKAAILILAGCLFPWVHLVAAVGFASIERHSEDAARLTLSNIRRVTHVVLPLVVGVIAPAWLFVFVLGLKNQSIAELLRQHVFATEILIDYQDFLDDRAAALKGLAFVAVSLGALALALGCALRRRRLAIEGLSLPLQPGEVSARGLSVAGPLVGAAILTFAVIVPLAVLIRTAGPWANYRLVWETAHDQIRTGFLTAAATATLSVTLGFVLAEFIEGSPGPLKALTAALVFVLFALPAPVLDIGLIQFWNRPGPLGWVYDRPILLVLGQTGTFLPIAVLGFWVALRRIDPRLIEAAELAALPWPTVARRILWPILRPWFVGLWTVVFVLALNDVEAAVLLASPGADTLSVRIMTMLHYMPDSHVAALCVTQVALTALAVGLVAAVVAAGRLGARIRAPNSWP